MSNINIIKTTSENSDFILLVNDLTRYLSVVDGDEHDFYNQYNGLEHLHHVVIVYDKENPIGCGAFKEYDSKSIEIKRMFVSTEARGKKVGSAILTHLEQWAKDEGYSQSVLETGIRMPDAIALYQNNGYKLIPNYAPYVGMDNSRCFLKQLT